MGRIWLQRIDNGISHLMRNTMGRKGKRTGKEKRNSEHRFANHNRSSGEAYIEDQVREAHETPAHIREKQPWHTTQLVPGERAQARPGGRAEAHPTAGWRPKRGPIRQTASVTAWASRVRGLEGGSQGD